MILKRKVRNGRVKINGSWYYPNEYYLQYDGRCDGYWFYFGTYDGIDNMVSLHSSVDESLQPHIVNHTLPWHFWYTNE